MKREVNDTDHVVDLTFEIAPGPQFALGKLAIMGLDIETEPVIRKMWGLQPGKPFNVEYPDHFLTVVKDSGTFDNLNIVVAGTARFLEWARARAATLVTAPRTKSVDTPARSSAPPSARRSVRA